ncbi:MAG: hypothetical protein ABIJ28_00320 [Patescibacteria group bacterium]
MYSNPNLRKKIMARIYFFWFYKKLTAPFVMELIVFAVLILGLSIYVSVGDVINNAPSLLSPANLFNFFTSAFFETELIVQMILLMVIAPVAFLIRDIKFLGINKKQAMA